MTEVYSSSGRMADSAGKIKVYNADRFDTALGVGMLEPVIGMGYATKKYGLVGSLNCFAHILDGSNVDYFYWLNVADFKDEFGDIEFSPDVIITDSPGEIRKYLRGLKL